MTEAARKRAEAFLNTLPLEALYPATIDDLVALLSSERKAGADAMREACAKVCRDYAAGDLLKWRIKRRRRELLLLALGYCGHVSASIWSTIALSAAFSAPVPVAALAIA